MLLYQILAFAIHRKKVKKTNLKYQSQRGMINVDCLMDQILYQIFKIILSVSSRNMRH